MEASMFSDNSVDSGIALDRIGCESSMSLNNKKVFDTVRYTNLRSNNISDNMLYLGAMAMSSSSQPRMSCSVQSSNEITNMSHLYPKSSTSYTSSIGNSSGICVLSSTENLHELEVIILFIFNHDHDSISHRKNIKIFIINFFRHHIQLKHPRVVLECREQKIWKLLSID